ncbi:MAG TPA: peptidylprolyl isomerase [Candidatus Gastranaerophilales bacterium]|nr:peptidylprolyl isomerase [Candidatus Gastranaerophilales bacterium]
MKKITLGLMATCLIFLGGCAQQQKADNSAPLIKVNANVITENMFNETLKQSYSMSGQTQDEADSKDNKNKFIYLVHKNRVINELILRELIKQESEKRQLKVEAKEIDEVLDSIAKNMGGKERLEASLALNKVNEIDFRENIKLDLLKKKLVTSITGDSKIKEEEIKKFYEENKEDKFKHAEEIRASHILISASEADIKNKISSENKEKPLSEQEINKKTQQEMEKAKAKAQKILVELKANPAKFEESAKTNSEDPSSASKGGDLGFFGKEEMVPEFSKTAFSMKPGSISDLVKTEFGYHIIKVIDRKQAGLTPYDEVKANIERYLEGKVQMETFGKLMDASRQSANIVYLKEEYNPENIKKEYYQLIETLQKTQNAESAKDQAAKPADSQKTEPVKTEKTKN